MRKAAHDLRDRAAVHAKVESRSGLAPSQHQNGVKDVARGLVLTGKLVGHDGSFTEIGLRGAVRLEKKPRRCEFKGVTPCIAGFFPSRIDLALCGPGRAGIPFLGGLSARLRSLPARTYAREHLRSLFIYILCHGRLPKLNHSLSIVSRFGFREGETSGGCIAAVVQLG